MENKNYEKQLPDVFNELKEIRKKQALQNNKQYEKKQINSKKNVKKLNNVNSLFEIVKVKEIINSKIQIKPELKRKIQKSNGTRKLNEEFNYDIYQSFGKAEIIDHKFNAIGAILGILFFVLFMTTIKSNYIFATSKEEEKKIIGTYEKNEDPIDLMECVSQNISEVMKKEIITETIVFEREIEYIEDNQFPKDEQRIAEEGKDELREVTYVRSYENDNLINEIIISDVLKQEMSKAVIYVGTSEFLKNNKAYIGDILYTTEKIPLMSEPKENSEQICSIYEYIDVILKSVHEDWCKIIVDGYEGYVKSEKLTSAIVKPEIIEKNRLKRLSLTAKIDMALNKPSGLTRQDFKKVLSQNINDVYRIFENNAELFFEIEQKYNINGIFIASIGIHESNWGTSRIAKDKNNLFGYGAYDSSPYASSVTFESYAYGIEYLAKMLTKYYINEPGTIIYDGEIAVGTYYNSPTVSGVNVRYASDPNWANAVYEIMSGLYSKLNH